MFSQKQYKKYHSKTQLDEKKLTFSRCSLSPRFSPLHVRWLLPYIIKNNSSSTNNEGLILDQCNGKIKLITVYAVHLELITETATRGVL